MWNILGVKSLEKKETAIKLNPIIDGFIDGLR